MNKKTRRIFKINTTSQREVKDLLQTIFIGEILSPSKCLWLISPWISNIVIINNENGSFSTLDPSWGRRQIRLVEVVGKIISLGAHTVIATRSLSHNESFLSSLLEYTDDIGAKSRLTIKKRDILHNKGILGDSYYLNGSMNITYNGIELLEEQITFDISKSGVAQARLAFHNSYGGMI